MKTIIIAILSLSFIGCNSQPQPQPQPINKDWVEAQQDINRTIIKLLETLNKDTEVRSIDFESLGLKPYSN